MGANTENPGPGPTQIGIRYDPLDAATAATRIAQDKAIAAALSWMALGPGPVIVIDVRTGQYLQAFTYR